MQEFSYSDTNIVISFVTGNGADVLVLLIKSCDEIFADDDANEVRRSSRASLTRLSSLRTAARKRRSQNLRARHQLAKGWSAFVLFCFVCCWLLVVVVANTNKRRIGKCSANLSDNPLAVSSSSSPSSPSSSSPSNSSTLAPPTGTFCLRLCCSRQH